MLTDEALSSGTGTGDALLQEAERLEEQESPRCIHAEQLGISIGELLSEVAAERTSDNICKILDIYLEQPFLLNPHLASWIPPLTKGLQSSVQTRNWPLAIAASRVLVAFCKLQGAKIVRSYFEHEVSDFIPTLLACKQAFDSLSELGVDGWQVRYATMIMSSTALLLPFSVDKLNAKATSEGYPSLISQITELAKEKLVTSMGRERQAAVLFLSTLMLRGDYDLAALLAYLTRTVIERLSNPDQHGALGALECIHLVIKQRREALLVTDLATILDALDGIEKSKDGHLRRIRLKIYSQLRDVWMSRSLTALIAGLSDADTIVRWTASKGCAQLCKELPGGAIRSLVEGLLATLNSNLSGPFPSMPACHGISLTLAQLCRLKLLPVDLVEPLIQVVAEALLRFEAPRGRFATTGAAIRDAACFIIWAMVRNYERINVPVALPGAIICVSLFDREVSCRRAAAAALQELVGRWDAPHGVELVDRISFFNTHHLRQTMGETAREIAATFPLYRPTMIGYLIDRSIGSWDRQVRTLAAPLLAHLIDSSDGESMVVTIREQLLSTAHCQDDISAQHGAILTLSWLSHGDASLLSKTLPVTRLLEHTSPKALGWELIAEAVHCLISKIARVARDLGYPIDGSTMDCWLRGVLQALQSRDATLHEVVAYKVLPALVSLYPAGTALISDFFRGSILPAADKDRNLHAQRGCTLAIAAFPDWLLKERSVPLAKLLTKFIQGGSGAQIEKRVNAIRAAGTLYASGMSATHVPAVAVRDELADTILRAMDDYTVDARGDIGSLVRLEAMEALPTLLGEQHYLRSQYEAKLARHVFDKLDRLRRRALQLLFPQPPLVEKSWEALVEAAYNASHFLHLWSVSPLRELFVSWDELRRSEALLGLISSVGSVNQLVARPAGDLLHSWLEYGIIQQTALLALLREQCSGRLQRAILILLLRMPRFDLDLCDELLQMTISVASNTNTNMHDINAAATLLVRLASIHASAASWVSQALVSHPFPRIRQVCMGEVSDGSS